MKTKSVLFVDQTPNGELAKLLRETLRRLEHILGFRVKIVEKTGTPIKGNFSVTKLWEGTPCGRGDCITCSQRGEEVVPCTRRNLVYENICLKCNPTAEKAGELKEANWSWESD